MSRRFQLARAIRWVGLVVMLWLVETDLLAQTNSTLVGQGNLLPFKLNVGLESASPPQEVDSAIKIVFALTLLTLAPSIILLMTCFTRIVIVLSFVRTAL